MQFRLANPGWFYQEVARHFNCQQLQGSLGNRVNMYMDVYGDPRKLAQFWADVSLPLTTCFVSPPGVLPL